MERQTGKGKQQIFSFTPFIQQCPSPLLIKKKTILYEPGFPKAMWASFPVTIMPQIKKPQHSKMVGNTFRDVRTSQEAWILI